MKRTLFFDHYRLASEYDGTPVVIGRVAPATVYKASDLRSGAPVAVTLLPVDAVPVEERERFEDRARAARLLDHMNIVRTVEFGQADEDYAFVSEHPQGDTLASWITENGPMPPDAALRVALQLVSALTAASFHHIHHRAIEPSNVIMIAGQTAEGAWPCVKLMNFGVAGGAAGSLPNGVANFASPEQLENGKVDFRSEIYSLGATLSYLLTGVFYSAEPRFLQTKRFARPLRQLIAPMLRQNPEERPQDPVMVEQEIRACLQKVERRQSWARRFGIPFVAVSARPPRKRRAPAQPQSILAAAFDKSAAPSPAPELPVVTRPPSRVWPRILTAAAVLIGAATVAAMLLPAPVSMIMHRNRNRDAQALGVPVGVAQASSSPEANSNNPAPVAAANNHDSPAPAGGSGRAPHTAMLVASSPAPDSSGGLASNSHQDTAAPPSPAAQAVVAGNQRVEKDPGPAASVAPARESTGSSDVSDRRIATGDSSPSSEPAPPAEGPQTVWERAAGSQAHPRMVNRKASGAASAETGNEEAGPDESTDSPNDLNDESVANDRSAAAHATARGPRVASGSDATRRHVVVSRRDSPRSFQGGEAIPGQTRHVTRAPIHGSVRARFAGTTPDGSLILRFPNGETAIIPPPPGQYVPGHRFHRSHRVIIERRSWTTPPPPYASLVPPDA